jgi:DNA invertase Pin-like site-specific DNA recombinase
MMNTTIKRFLRYRRVSTGEQGTAGTSLDGQSEELTQLAVHMGAPLTIDFVEVESGAAGKEERRVEVARLLATVRAGDVVAVTKFDRFTRDLEFAIRKVREILAKGARFISIAEGEFDRSPEGELKLSIWASIAQMERARIYDRTNGQKVRLRAQGKLVDGMPPPGYLRAKGRHATDKPRQLVIDPAKAPSIVEAFQLCIEGLSATDIARNLRAKYAEQSFSSSWVARALTNRVYTGQLATTPVRRRGDPLNLRRAAQWLTTHEPIVAPELWSRAQAALASRRSGGDRPRADSGTKSFLLRSLASCGLCGHVVTSIPEDATRSTKRPAYYVCRHRPHAPNGRPRCLKAPYVHQLVIDAAIERETLARLVDLRACLADAPEPQQKAPDFEAKRAGIAARRKRLVQAVAAGKLALEDIDAPITVLEAERADLEVAAAEHAARSGNDTVEGRRTALAFVEVVSAAWAGLTAPERRNVLAILAERLVLTVERKVDITWRDASGLSASVASVRPELVAHLGEAVPAAPALDAASEGPQRRATKRAPRASRSTA